MTSKDQSQQPVSFGGGPDIDVPSGNHDHSETADHACFRHAPLNNSADFVGSSTDFVLFDTKGCQICGSPLKVLYARDAVVLNRTPQEPSVISPEVFEPLGTGQRPKIADDAPGSEYVFFNVPAMPEGHVLHGAKIHLRYAYLHSVFGDVNVDENDGRVERYYAAKFDMPDIPLPSVDE